MNTQTTDNLTMLSNSAEIFDICEKIGQKFELHIDQVGQLDARIRQILRGKAKSSNLIEDIQQYLEIDSVLANQIATEVNKEIFSTIKSNLQSQTETAEENKASIAALERSGNFTIEREIPSEPGHGNSGYEVSNGNGVTQEDRDKILAGLENPPPPKGVVPVNLPTVETEEVAENKDVEPSPPQENDNEPLVDYLISNPAAQGEKEEQKPNSPTQNRGPDPYREEVR